MTSPDYATELIDSETLVNQRCSEIISTLPAIASFFANRVSLEREFAKKLAAQAANARAAATKGPSIDSTFHQAWLHIIDGADRESRIHDTLATSLSKIVDQLNASGVQKDGIRKKHHAFAKTLLAERDKSYYTRDKSKSNYFAACTALSTARSRLTAATEDGKQVDKANKIFEQAQVDMEIAKNQLLLDTELANLAKRHLYSEDLPSAMSDFQQLERSSLSHSSNLITAALGLLKTNCATLDQGVEEALAVMTRIDVDADQRTFIEACGGRALVDRWELPKDLEFEESPVWHDTSEFITTPTSVTFFQNLSLHSQATLATLKPQIASSRKEIAGLRNLLAAYEKDRSLGDAGAILESLFDATRHVVGLELQAEEATARIEIIASTLGETTTGQKLHDLKSSSYITPVPCIVCVASIWGRGLACRACGAAVHTKCELHIPADCGMKSSRVAGGSNGSSLDRTNSTASSARVLPPPRASLTGSSSFASPSSSLAPETADLSFISSPTTFLPPTPRPPPGRQPSLLLRQVTMAYEYQALTGFELTVAENEVVSILEEEDSEGWIKVRTSDHREGLIPASYIRNDESRDETVEQENLGEVRAIYDYAAASEEELSLAALSIYRLVSEGSSDGWSEVEIDGRRGIVPTSYLETV